MINKVKRISQLILISIMSLLIISCGDKGSNEWSADTTEDIEHDGSNIGTESDLIIESVSDTNIQVEPSGKVEEQLKEKADEKSFEPMEVHFIDVGEGDCTLIICGSESMLIDAGVPEQGTAIRLYLKKQSVNRLKYLLLTHSDKDHIGGAASVVSNVPIDNLFMCKYEKDNEVYLNLINEINYKSMTWSTPDVGSEYTLGDATITVIAPNREYDNPNDSSIGVIIRHGDDSFIFTGDAEKPAEEDIINNGLDIKAEVYHVGHHGSRTASSDQFIDMIDPHYAIISCETDNKYGHPHIETMEKLKERGVILYRTDEQGTIIAYSDGKDLTFNTAPSENWTAGTEAGAESASTQVKQALLETESGANINEQVEKTIPSEEETKEFTYIANTNTKKFHYPECDSVKDMKEKNKWEVTTTREDLINQGYKPCGKCKP